MNEAEFAWLNAYHADVYAKTSLLVEGEELAWLEAATVEIFESTC